jgi:hypothetical protein
MYSKLTKQYSKQGTTLHTNTYIISLTLILLTWTIWRAPTNASKWRMGFNSAFKGLNKTFICVMRVCSWVCHNEVETQAEGI